MGTRVLISGSGGLIGRALVPALQAAGHPIARLVRASTCPEPDIPRDPAKGQIDTVRLSAFAPEVVVHLAGESVFGWWNKAKKQRILDSRVCGTRTLMAALRSLPRPPGTVVSASAVGYYGDCGDREVTETDPPGTGFLAEVCRAWEAEAAMPAGRVVLLRIGVVLSAEGGAIKSMLPIFWAGLGGPIAGGQTWIPWISLSDTVRAIQGAITNARLVGSVNVVGPSPVQQSELARTLATVLNRPALLPVPRWLISATLGELARETALKSIRALPRRLDETGFQFRHTRVEAAIRNALGRE